MFIGLHHVNHLYSKRGYKMGPNIYSTWKQMVYHKLDYLSMCHKHLGYISLWTLETKGELPPEEGWNQYGNMLVTCWAYGCMTAFGLKTKWIPAIALWLMAGVLADQNVLLHLFICIFIFQIGTIRPSQKKAGLVLASI